jgi:chromosome partitioning protein
MIIGVLSQKGGVGKTTIAVNAAATLATRGRRVLLVDADPQGSSLAWSSARDRDPLFPVVGMAKPSLHRDLPEIAKDYDVVVIDGAPRVNELGRSAILASDTILIPVQPSPYDVWAAAVTVQLIREAHQFRDSLTAAFVINRKIVNTAIGRDVASALDHFGTPVLPGHLCQRVVYAESASQGLSVVEVAPQSEAAREMATLVSSIAQVPDRRQAA